MHFYHSQNTSDISDFCRDRQLHFRQTGHVHRLTNLSVKILSQKNCTIFNQNLYCGLIVILHNTLSAFWLSTGSWSKKFGDARKWNNSGRLMHYKKSKKTYLYKNQSCWLIYHLVFWPKIVFGRSTLQTKDFIINFFPLLFWYWHT